jgi:Family of unknown function (DUF6152)
MRLDDAISFVRELPLKRDMPLSPIIAMGSASGAIGRYHALGRCFFRPRTTTFAFRQAHDAAAASREPWNRSTRGNSMRRQMTALVSCAFVAASGAALAHHSFAMFDQENPIELEGVVQEFKFTSPHTFIILQVKQPDGSTQLWSLEGGTPSTLARDGWSSKTLKPGDELQLTIEPLRSGAPGGSWAAGKTKFKDGRPIMVTP